jgi:hypothetical protein
MVLADLIWQQLKILGEALMQTVTKKRFVIYPLLALLFVGLASNAFAADAADHHVLANQYENLAQEMQAKVEEQKDIFNHKPRSSYFGRNGQRLKSHVMYKIQKYENAAEKYSQQAAHHNALAAGQGETKSMTKQKQTNSNKS